MRSHFIASLVAVFSIGLADCSDKPRAIGPAPDGGPVTVLPRVPHLATYPCMRRCHDNRAPDPTPREMREFHTGRVLRHGPTLRSCDFCHRTGDLDHLRLISGDAISFDESYRLCGQCHGEKLRDWEHGVHGSQSGSWAGARMRRACTVCHDPHAPKRPLFDPLPTPDHDRAFPPGSHGGGHGGAAHPAPSHAGEGRATEGHEASGQSPEGHHP